MVKSIVAFLLLFLFLGCNFFPVSMHIIIMAALATQLSNACGNICIFFFVGEYYNVTKVKHIGPMSLYFISTCATIPGSDLNVAYVQPPVTPGHEFVGEVVKLGPGKYCTYVVDELVLP